MQAVERAAARLALEWVTPVAAVLMTVTALGSVGAWLEAVARIPFAAGLDRSLPAAFGRLRRVLVPLAVVGLVTTASSIVLAALPAPGEPDKAPLGQRRDR